MKRIALIGNMNNNFFAITRYLRDEGYDAHLFYRVAMEHFQPFADTYSSEYESYCHAVSWLDNGFHNVDRGTVIKDLQGFDFYIGQGDEAAVAKFAEFNMDVYYPYGSDVYKYAGLPQAYSRLSKIKSLVSTNDARPTYKQMQRGTLAKYLRAAIVDAKYILAETTNKEFTERLDALDYKGVYYNTPMPFIYASEYENLDSKHISLEIKEQVDIIRKTYDFILLYHGRQEWKTYHNDFTSKNTHHLIQGFALYIRENSGIKACLVMLDYGTDVVYSKQLIDELGIGMSVYWLPKMYRKDLMYVISQVDVCSGEFGRSYLTFGTVVEAMLMKKPVITYRQDELYNSYDTLYPCYNAREPKEIQEAISDAVSNPQDMKQKGDESYRWIKQNFISKPLQQLIALIEQYS